MAAFMIALVDEDAEEKKAVVLDALRTKFPQHTFEIIPDPPMDEESNIYPVLAQPHPMTPDQPAVDISVPPDVAEEVRKAFDGLIAES
jgi:hypothetical protein